MADIRRLSLNLKNLLLTGLVGWIVSLYTLWHRAKVQAGVEIGESFCNINSKINCDSVALSSYSKILGVSVPTYGLIFFTIVSLLAMRALHQFRQGAVGETTKKLLTLTSAVGVVTSIALAILSLTQIGAFCLVCAIIYVLCLVNLYFVWQIKKLHAETPWTKDVLTSGAMFLYGAVIIAQFAFQPLADFAARQGQPTEEALPAEFATQLSRDYIAANAYEIPVQSSPAFGPESAPVTVVEFSDFQCPHCANNHKNMPTSLSSFGDKVRVIYKNFPLDPACNTGGSHRNACFAARAARCVFKNLGGEKFKAIQDYLFENRDSFTKDSVKAKVVELGMKDSEFTACVESAPIAQEIKDEIDLGKSIGVEGTPALFVNGKNVKNGTNSSVFKVIIKGVLDGTLK